MSVEFAPLVATYGYPAALVGAVFEGVGVSIDSEPARTRHARDVPSRPRQGSEPGSRWHSHIKHITR